ncbi:sphingomyelin phosphodiesterase isoform 3-T8 [Salvelinus alpinus]
MRFAPIPCAVGLLCCVLVLCSVPLGTSFPVQDEGKPGITFLEEVGRLRVGFNWRNLTCPVCKVLFTILDIALLSDVNEERVARAVGEACIRLHLAEERVCRQITELFRDDFISALQQSLLWPSEACALLVGRSCGRFDIYAPWNVTLPRIPKPPVTPPTPPKPGAPQSRVLFLTDIHWDQEYAVGSSADCKDPLCCRNESGSPDWRQRAAGFWGSYSKCDLPLRTVENMLENAARTGPWDWVYWTGDIPAHNIWSQTRKQQLSELTVITRLIHSHLGNLKVYPAIGNHESTPVNSFPPPFVHGNRSSRWLYDTMAEEWAPWLPEEALKTLRYGGFYTVEVQPGLRVVSLNMNFCARENYWLMVNSTDPANQLQWLIHILQASEEKGERVHIIGHIPPGLCLSSWSWNYYHIINRYEGTITGQFFLTVVQDRIRSVVGGFNVCIRLCPGMRVRSRIRSVVGGFNVCIRLCPGMRVRSRVSSVVGGFNVCILCPGMRVRSRVSSVVGGFNVCIRLCPGMRVRSRVSSVVGGFNVCIRLCPGMRVRSRVSSS